jgi:hypothetical protein
MKKVLIISYYFPPDPSIGSLRAGGLAKYLPSFGWEPIILTKKIPHTSNDCRIITTQYSNYDSIASFKKKIGMSTETVVSNSLNFSKKGINSKLFNMLYFVPEIIAYPDPQKDWYDSAFNVACNFLTHEKVDAIISSSYPVTCHIIAHDLSTKYSIPWIADFRDLWTQSHYYPYSRIRRFFERRLEVKSMASANSFTTISQNLAAELKKIHNNICVYSILNGFDLDDINNLETNLTDKFTITYTGSLYLGKRDPSKLFQALSELFAENAIDPQKVKVQFYGQRGIWMLDEIKKYNLERVVIQCGSVSRDVALLKQRESQVLLLLLWDHPSEVGVYTGKLFEYLASKRPILAIGGSKGVVNELLEETEAGYFVSSVEDIKNIIIKYYNEYKLNGEVSYKGNNSKIEKYSQKEMARKFAEVLDNSIKVND